MTRKLLPLLFLILSLCGSAAAQTTTFNGLVKDLTNTPVPTGQVSFVLKPGLDTTISGNARFTSTSVFCEIHNPAVVSTSGTGTITVVVNPAQTWQVGDKLLFAGTADATLNANTVATAYVITLANSPTSYNFTQAGTHANGAGGTVGGIYASGGTGGCAVMQNTALNVANTSYSVGLWPLFSLSSTFNTYAIGAGPVDISTIVPTPSQQPSYSFVDTFSAQTITGLKTFNGGISGVGSLGALTAGAGITANPNTWSANQSFNSGNLLLLGSVSGSASLHAASTAGTSDWTLPNATDQLIGRNTADTLTNKSINGEGAGNVITLPEKIWLSVAVCDNATAGTALDLPTANAPTKSCWGTSPHRFGTLSFAKAGTVLTGNFNFTLPADWTGATDIKFIWFSGSTSTNNVVLTVATACVDDAADLINPTYNATQTVVKANNAVASTRNSASVSSITTTGCTAGKTMFLRVGRDPTSGSDTLAATIELMGVELTYRRAM